LARRRAADTPTLRTLKKANPLRGGDAKPPVPGCQVPG
jgi:hypothetical protein